MADPFEEFFSIPLTGSPLSFPAETKTEYDDENIDTTASRVEQPSSLDEELVAGYLDFRSSSVRDIFATIEELSNSIDLLQTNQWRWYSASNLQPAQLETRNRIYRAVRVLKSIVYNHFIHLLAITVYFYSSIFDDDQTLVRATLTGRSAPLMTFIDTIIARYCVAMRIGVQGPKFIRNKRQWIGLSSTERRDLMFRYQTLYGSL